MKTLLLDIDFTTFYEKTPRPFLREFLERAVEAGYQIRFYTAADHIRITDVCRVLFHQMNLSHEFVKPIHRQSLSRDNCPMIEYRTSECTAIDIKCLDKAAARLGIAKEDLLLLDDTPMHDNPDAAQRITVPAFYGQENDTFLRDFQFPNL